MYSNRIRIYKELEKAFDSYIIAYITSDRPNAGAQISTDAIDHFISHLDKIKRPCKKISLFLYTRGGDVAAARNIVNLIRMFGDTLQVIVPHKAHSAGTIICLGANEIIMTKQATLGPIDPSLQSPLNPRTPEGNPFSVSVEAVNGYLEYAKKYIGKDNPEAIVEIFKKLTEYVHPLVLGEVFRSKSQIPMIASDLLKNQEIDEEHVKQIISFLCSDSGSHDYTINRREAEELGLSIKKPNDEEYALIKELFDDISDELQLTHPFSMNEVNGAYSLRRCILESIVGGSHYYSSEGTIVHGALPNGQPTRTNIVKYEGWRHEQAQAEIETVVDEISEEVTYEHSSGNQS